MDIFFKLLVLQGITLIIKYLHKSADNPTSADLNKYLQECIKYMNSATEEMNKNDSF